MRIAVIGYGTIARAVLATLPSVTPGSLSAVGVLSRAGRREHARQSLGFAGPVIESLDDLLALRPDAIAECAGAEAVRAHGPEILRRGIDFYIVSVSALVDDELRDLLQKAAEAGGSQLHITSGATGGLDVLGALRLSGLQQVQYVMRKPPRAWIGSPAAATTDLARLSEPVTVFSGTARSAGRLYPNNANSAVAVALASAGLDSTLVTLIADPHTSVNVHEIKAIGAQAEVEIRIAGRPSDNPRTSSLTASGLCRALQRHASAISV